jgi:pimeloyl-ACP methyl ester carboxylesterase
MSDEHHVRAIAGRSSLRHFRSLDGLRLEGTVVVPSVDGAQTAVLVHGGGVNRDEGGFFTRLADGLAAVGVASLRFDFRAHGESEGDQKELTLAGVANDIRAAVEHARATIGDRLVHLIGASFGGGITALFASRHPDLVRTLVLFNPLLNYKRRFIDEKPYWTADHIDEDAARELTQNGFIPHSPSFKLGRPLLNELFVVQPDRLLGEIVTPTLTIHGTRDTFIPVEGSRGYVPAFKVEARLLEIEGAQHGFAVHDDPEYRDPQTQEWQAFVIRSVADWVLVHP